MSHRSGVYFHLTPYIQQVQRGTGALKIEAFAQRLAVQLKLRKVFLPQLRYVVVHTVALEVKQHRLSVFDLKAVNDSLHDIMLAVLLLQHGKGSLPCRVRLRQLSAKR